MKSKYKATIKFNNLCIPVVMQALYSEDNIENNCSCKNYNSTIEPNQTLSIDYFCKSKEISNLLFEKSYYVIPEIDSQKEYQLLRRAMTTSRVVGIATMTIDSKEKLIALFANADCIIAIILYYEDEINDLPIIFKRKVDTNDLDGLNNEIINSIKEFDWIKSK